jgi:hypothetical protein
MFRSPDASNGYLADLRADGGLNVWRQSNGAFTLLRLGDVPAGFDPAVDHLLGVRVRGDRIVPSLDGKDQPEVTDASFATGRVGVRAVSDQHSSWDTLRVVDADGQELFSQDFADSAALDAFDLPAASGRRCRAPTWSSTTTSAATTARCRDGPPAPRTSSACPGSTSRPWARWAGASPRN